MKKASKFLYIFLIFYAVIALFPFLWALLASFRSNLDILNQELIGGAWTLENYKEVIFDDDMFLRWVFNTVLISTIGTFLCVLFNTMAGYALSRIDFKGRKFLLTIVLIVIVIPGQVLMIPNYIIIRNMGLLDTYLSLILPGIASATYIYMMSQFFKNFPTEVEEAARIDGLSRVKSFFKIVIPLAKPAIATQTVFIFIGFWNSFQSALLYMQSPEMYTLQLGLKTLQTTNASQWGLIMAGSMLSVLPLIIIYICANKYFMEGMTFGGSK